MSDLWIRGERLLKAVGGKTQLAAEIEVDYVRLLAKVSPDGSVVYRKLNNLGVDTGAFNPLNP